MIRKFIMYHNFETITFDDNFIIIGKEKESRILGVITGIDKAEEYICKYSNPVYYDSAIARGEFLFMFHHEITMEEISGDVAYLYGTLDVSRNPWGKETRTDFEIFCEIAEYVNEINRCFLSNNEILENAAMYLQEYIESYNNPVTESMKELYRLLIESGSEQARVWAFKIAFNLELIDMNYYEFRKANKETMLQFIESEKLPVRRYYNAVECYMGLEDNSILYAEPFLNEKDYQLELLKHEIVEKFKNEYEENDSCLNICIYEFVHNMFMYHGEAEEFIQKYPLAVSHIMLNIAISEEPLNITEPLNIETENYSVMIAKMAVNELCHKYIRNELAYVKALIDRCFNIA